MSRVPVLKVNSPNTRLAEDSSSVLVSRSQRQLKSSAASHAVVRRSVDCNNCGGNDLINQVIKNVINTQLP